MDRGRHVGVWLRLLAIGEVRLARQSLRLLKKQGKAAAAGFKKAGIGESEAIIREGQGDWFKLLTAHYTTTTKTLINYTFEQLGAKKASFQDIVQRFIAQNALQKSSLITGTTLDLIKSALLQGQEQGLGQDDIAELISEKLGGDISESRAKTIARTEIHNAATYGMQVAAEETELALIREWVSVHDERTREAHVDADGQQVELDQPFDVGGELIDRPGEGSAENSINCRCTVIYIPKTAEVSGGSSGEFIDG